MKRWIHAASQLDARYRGIWYGAQKNPMTVKDLLDRVIQSNGRGFTITVSKKYTSDNLLDDTCELDIRLQDEDRRGSLKLKPDAIEYLKDNLNEDSWLYTKLNQI